MERMRSSKDATRHTQLNNAVGVEGNNTSNRHEILSILLPANDLKENWDSGRDKGGTVDEEVCPVL